MTKLIIQKRLIQIIPENFGVILQIWSTEKRKIPDTVEIDRILHSDQNRVLTEWRTRFENTYQKPESAKQWYDETFYETCIHEPKGLESLYSCDNSSVSALNKIISNDELCSVLKTLRSEGYGYR